MSLCDSSQRRGRRGCDLCRRSGARVLLTASGPWSPRRSRARQCSRCERGTERDVLWSVVPAHAEGTSVVEFETACARNTSTLGVHVAAPASVTLPHGTANRSGDVARRRTNVESLRRVPSEGLGRGKASGLEPFELQGDGRLDDRGQIAVRHLRPHQGSESLELVVELRAGRELHLVPSGRQRLNRRAAPWERAEATTASGRSSRVCARGWVRVAFPDQAWTLCPG